MNLDGVSIISLSPKNTSRHQSLDLGLIAVSKICYITALLEATIDVLQRYNVSDSPFKINSGRGKWGLEEGQLPHMADAMNLFNKAWNLTSCQSVLKC